MTRAHNFYSLVLKLRRALSTRPRAGRAIFNEFGRAATRSACVIAKLPSFLFLYPFPEIP